MYLKNLKHKAERKLVKIVARPNKEKRKSELEHKYWKTNYLHKVICLYMLYLIHKQ